MAAALVVLAVITAAVGPAVGSLPLTALRLVVGALLAVFGLQWLRKAVLRATGYKALHDEASAYLREVAAATQAGAARKRGISDWYSFTLAFKGVLLEGLEVVFIVITFGDNQKDIGAAVIGAAAAIIVVTVTGIAVQGPADQGPGELDEVRRWASCSPASARSGAPRAPGSPGRATTPPCSSLSRWSRSSPLPASPGCAPARPVRPCPLQGIGGCRPMKQLKSFGAFWYDFIVGDDWRVPAGVVAGLALTALLAHVARVNAWWACSPSSSSPPSPGPSTGQRPASYCGGSTVVTRSRPGGRRSSTPP